MKGSAIIADIVPMTLEMACASQDRVLLIMVGTARETRTDVTLTWPVTCAAQKKTRCAAAFNGDETDCAGVLMIVLMTNVPGSVAPKDWKKRKVIDLIESNRIKSN